MKQTVLCLQPPSSLRHDQEGSSWSCHIPLYHSASGHVVPSAQNAGAPFTCLEVRCPLPTGLSVLFQHIFLATRPSQGRINCSSFLPSLPPPPPPFLSQIHWLNASYMPGIGQVAGVPETASGAYLCGSKMFISLPAPPSLCPRFLAPG